MLTRTARTLFLLCLRRAHKYSVVSDLTVAETSKASLLVPHGQGNIFLPATRTLKVESQRTCPTVKTAFHGTADRYSHNGHTAAGTGCPDTCLARTRSTLLDRCAQPQSGETNAITA